MGATGSMWSNGMVAAEKRGAELHHFLSSLPSSPAQLSPLGTSQLSRCLDLQLINPQGGWMAPEEGKSREWEWMRLLICRSHFLFI